MAIQHCMLGDGEAFYDHEYLKVSKIKKETCTYTQNIKISENVIGISSHIKSQMAKRMRIEMKSYGLILIILAKNWQALDAILKAYP